VREPHKLDAPDIHFVAAAEGWLGLGLPREAIAELRHVSCDALGDPTTLNLLWMAHAEIEEWDLAHDVANRLVECAPKEPNGWIHRAYAIRRKSGGSIQEAWIALYPAVQLFPDESIIPYNLACYSCQLGNLGEAVTWFERACAANTEPRVVATLRNMALADDDLEGVWEEIRKLP
jgi:Flp pilus assembly protein TadD